MKARPLLYSAPMIRAIIAGRKSQTRWIIKPQPIWADSKFSTIVCSSDRKHAVKHRWIVFKDQWAIDESRSSEPFTCPYGRPGDLLWAREAFANTTPFAYRADFPGNPTGMGWRPGIHMPRKANRITQAIKSIRVERLQDISEEDAIAEGVENIVPRVTEDEKRYGWAYWNYQCLWDEINGHDPAHRWDANPWVWAIEAETHLCNIDDFIATNGGAA